MLKKLAYSVSLVLILAIVVSGEIIAASGAQKNVNLFGRALVDRPVYAASVDGSYAYVCAGLALVILNVSDASNPTKEGRLLLPSVAHGDLYVSGGYAYVAEMESGLRVIDVADPVNPVEADGGRTEG